MRKRIPNLVIRTYDDTTQGKANFWDDRQKLRDLGKVHTACVVTLAIVEGL